MSGEPAVEPPFAIEWIVNVRFTSRSVGTVIEYPVAVITGAEMPVYGAENSSNK